MAGEGKRRCLKYPWKLWCHLNEGVEQMLPAGPTNRSFYFALTPRSGGGACNSTTTTQSGQPTIFLGAHNPLRRAAGCKSMQGSVAKEGGGGVVQAGAKFSQAQGPPMQLCKGRRSIAGLSETRTLRLLSRLGGNGAIVCTRQLAALFLLLPTRNTCSAPPSPLVLLAAHG